MLRLSRPSFSSTSSSAFCATRTLLKKSGKPGDTPAYTQAYLPYETAPTKLELDQQRKKFSQAYFGYNEHRKLVEVKDVPDNMYTYGKEGMTVPISIFKEQKDPTIGPEWTYPGIYENKIVLKDRTLQSLFEEEQSGQLSSPWLKDVLEARVQQSLSTLHKRMARVTMKQMDVFHKERGASKKVGAPTDAPK